MNVTFQTNKFNSQNYGNLKTCKPKPQSFCGAENVITHIPVKSKFFSPITKGYDSFVEWIARQLGKIADKKWVERFGEKTKNSDEWVNHLTALGSAVISGVYVTRTLQNKKLDKDRKRTLAINQGLVFGLSTAGSYLLDGSLNSRWQNVMAKFSALKLEHPEIYTGFMETNKKITEENKAIKLANKTSIIKQKLKSKIKIEKYLEEHLGYDLTHNKHVSFEKLLKGMNFAKKLLIFAIIYRYITPVIVTPIANKIGEHILLRKKAREAEAHKAQMQVSA